MPLEIYFTAYATPSLRSIDIERMVRLEGQDRREPYDSVLGAERNEVW